MVSSDLLLFLLLMIPTEDRFSSPGNQKEFKLHYLFMWLIGTRWYGCLSSVQLSCISVVGTVLADKNGAQSLKYTNKNLADEFLLVFSQSTSPATDGLIVNPFILYMCSFSFLYPGVMHTWVGC